MASSSSSSSRHPRKWPDLPVIFCRDCRWRKVIVLTSHTMGNPDMVFFTCPNQLRGKGRDKKGCEFYLWEEDCMQYLKDNHGYKPKIEKEGGTIAVAGLLGGGRAQEAMCTTAVEDKETGLLGSVVNKRFDQEITIVLKALPAVGVVCLGGMICILVVLIMK